MEILTFSEAAGVIVMNIGVTATGQDQGDLTPNRLGAEHIAGGLYTDEYIHTNT